MDKFSLYVPNFLPCREYFNSGKNNACPGCGLSLGIRHIYKAAEQAMEKATWEKISSVNFLGMETGGSILRIKQPGNETVFFLDNEASNDLKNSVKKDMPSMAIAEGCKYVATACPSHPFDLYEKTKKALDMKGKSFVHVLCPCPEGWQFDAENCVKTGFAAVETLAFPLYEVVRGYHSLTIETPVPKKLAGYLKAQGRFSNLTETDISRAEAIVEKEYSRLLEKIKSGYNYTFETSGPVY